MGWDFRDTGFQVVLSAEVPRITRENIGRDVDGFLASQGLARARTCATGSPTPAGPRCSRPSSRRSALPDGALRALLAVARGGGQPLLGLGALRARRPPRRRASPARAISGCSSPWGPASAPRWYSSGGERDRRVTALWAYLALLGLVAGRAGRRALGLDPQRAPAALAAAGWRPAAALPGDGGLPRPLPPGAGARRHRLPRAALALGPRSPWPGPSPPRGCAGGRSRTLGDRWSTRVIVLPGARPVTGGPYRFLRHPNYLAVVAGDGLPAARLGHVAASPSLFTLGNARHPGLPHPRRGAGARPGLGAAPSRGRGGSSRDGAAGDPARAGGRRRDPAHRPGASCTRGPSSATTRSWPSRLDSLALLSLVVAVEDRFRIVLTDEDAATARSLADLARIVAARAAPEVAP